MEGAACETPAGDGGAGPGSERSSGQDWLLHHSEMRLCLPGSWGWGGGGGRRWETPCCHPAARLPCPPGGGNDLELPRCGESQTRVTGRQPAVRRPVVTKHRHANELSVRSVLRRCLKPCVRMIKSQIMILSETNCLESVISRSTFSACIIFSMSIFTQAE